MIELYQGVPEVLSCVLTDDDPLSRQLLETHIAHTPRLRLVKAVADGMQLLELLRAQLRIDVVFLDVQMPGLSGLDVIRLLPVSMPVVLVSTSTNFAVQAFELNVVDYLVKPVEYPRFMQAVERVWHHHALVKSAEQFKQVVNAPVAAVSSVEPSLFIKTGGRLTRIAHDNILYLEAVNDQAVVVTSNRQVLTNQLLREFEQRLPAPHFARIHRSYIVNCRKIESIEDGVITMEGGRTVPIGRTYLSGFMASFNG